MLGTPTYRDHFYREVNALAMAARGNLTARVPSCPDWTVAELVSHLAFDVYAPRIVHIRERPRGDVVNAYEDLEMPAAFKAWYESDWKDLALLPPGLLDVFAETANRLESALYALPVDEPVHTWWEPSRSAGFLQRRMALETAVHRWDAQLAHGTPEPIEADLAADGIDETFEVMLPARRGWATSPPQGSGETYHFHRTDGPGEWLVRFAPEGPVVTREHAKGDVAVRGPASELLLFLWHRIPAERLEVFGDAALLERYFVLVPPD